MLIKFDCGGGEFGQECVMLMPDEVPIFLEFLDDAGYAVLSVDMKNNVCVVNRPFKWRDHRDAWYRHIHGELRSRRYMIGKA